MDNEAILDMLRFLSEIGKPVWIRHVLVPTITDNDVYLRRTRAFIATLGNVEKIEILPYHSFGVYKWHTLGIPYTLDGIQPPTRERVAIAKNILEGKI